MQQIYLEQIREIIIDNAIFGKINHIGCRQASEQSEIKSLIS
jgi:hypothetical protein